MKDDKGQEMMKVSIEANGEFITTEAPQNKWIEAVFTGSHLRGITVMEPRAFKRIVVNGAPE